MKTLKPTIIVIGLLLTCFEPGVVIGGDTCGHYEGPQYFYPFSQYDNQPWDVKDSASRALKGFMTEYPTTFGPNNEYARPYFAGHLLEFALAGSAPWDHGDCTGRAIGAWDGLREISGDYTSGTDTEKRNRDYLLSLLDPEFGLPYRSNSKPEKGIYCIQSWDVSRTFRGLINWYRAHPEQREMLKPIIRQICQQRRKVYTRSRR